MTAAYPPQPLRCRRVTIPPTASPSPDIYRRRAFDGGPAGLNNKLGASAGAMRYAAKMIFEYTVAGEARKRLTCECRIVLLRAASAESALRKANARGAREQMQYRNVEGNDARIRFIGLADLIELDPMCASDETWYSVFSSANPARLVRKNKELSVFRPLPSAIGSAIRFAPAEPTKRGKKRPDNKRRA